METFKPGDVIRMKGVPKGCTYLVVVGGYVEMRDWHFHSSARQLTDEQFEKVEAVTHDEHLIPLGRHQARCGCTLQGRSLISPCETHRETFGLTDLSAFSMPTLKKPLFPKMCTGRRDCPAEKHANDCPKWEE